MRKITALTALVSLLLTAALAQAQAPAGPIAQPPALPGVVVAAELGPVCPRLPPTSVDCNGDGVADYIHASYHTGDLHSYLPPEVAQALGLFGMAAALKPVTNNQNFLQAGVVDGASHQLLWSFRAGGLLSHFAVDAQQQRLYLGSHDNHIYTLDLASGKVLWQQDLGGNPLGMTFSRDLLIEVNTRNVLIGHRLSDGTTAWEKPVKTAVMSHPDFGILRYDQEAVFISSLDDHVYAVEQASGKQRWDFLSGGNPSLRLIAGGALLVADKKQLIALEIDTGKVRWRHPTEGYVHGEPMVDIGGAVALFNGRPGKQAAFFALDLATGEKRWSVPLEKIARDKNRKIFLPEDTLIMKNALAVEREEAGAVRILFVADKVKMQAIDASSGNLLWSTPIAGAQLLLRAADRLVVADKAKAIYSLDAADGKEKWRRTVDAHVFQMEAVGGVLLATLYNAQLAAFDFATGTPHGQHRLGEPFRLVPQADGQVILCGQRGSWLLAAEKGAVAEPTEKGNGGR